MEKAGFIRVLDRCKEALAVDVVVTDRSPSIKATIRDQYPGICHQFDVWHFAKNVASKLRSACHRKSHAPLLAWIPAIISHFWWCCSNCDGSADLLKERWQSVLYHVCNTHAWTGGQLCSTCAHSALSSEDERAIKWIKADSEPYKALKGILLDKKLLKDMDKLTKFCHTGSLEVYHSVMTKYIPKRIHFSILGMIVRTQLAALDHNFNVNRHHSKAKKTGEGRYKVQFSRHKGDYVAKKIYDRKSYAYVDKLMCDVVAVAHGELDVPALEKRVSLPISRRNPPEKAEVVAKLTSRLEKKKA
ncbi:uncharacterized protein LOC135826412 [Sycon ciliatum]|uniref:uncharacterized protein LOC135826412 n=1 Tax=Sycon ciliatum TaxID=27933 RepID=UPI0031F63FF3